MSRGVDARVSVVRTAPQQAASRRTVDLSLRLALVVMLLGALAACAAPVYVCQPAEMNGRPILVCVPLKPEMPR